jgi:hypothetical protein
MERKYDIRESTTEYLCEVSTHFYPKMNANLEAYQCPQYFIDDKEFIITLRYNLVHRCTAICRQFDREKTSGERQERSHRST